VEVAAGAHPVQTNCALARFQGGHDGSLVIGLWNIVTPDGFDVRFQTVDLTPVSNSLENEP
jgi:hypothetical protein